jgi:hypothetical protein
MPYIDNSLAVAEDRVRALRAKIELRRSQQNLPTHQGPKAETGRSDVHLASLYKELASAAAVVIAGRFDPLDVLEKMGWK